MRATMIDTLEISKKFEKVGFKREEAEVLAEVISETQKESRDELATKHDIEALEYRLTIKLTAIMAALLTFLSLGTDFIRHLFKF